MLIDDTNTKGEIGGKAYGTYEIGSEGAVVIVRPDGYIGMMSPLGETGAKEIDAYFSKFLKV